VSRIRKLTKPLDLLCVLHSFLRFHFEMNLFNLDIPIEYKMQEKRFISAETRLMLLFGVCLILIINLPPVHGGIFSGPYSTFYRTCNVACAYYRGERYTAYIAWREITAKEFKLTFDKIDSVMEKCCTPRGNCQY